MTQEIIDGIAEAVAETKDQPGQVPEGEQPAQDVPVEGTEDSTAPPVDVPETYFGVPLGDLPPEKRQEIIDAFKAKDSRITKLEQRLAEQRKAEEENPTPVLDPEFPETPSDEDILALIGITPDDEYYEVAKRVSLPTLKQNLILTGKLENLAQTTEQQQARAIWNEGLDALEAEYGKLPLPRESVLDFAADQEIYDPEVAYMKLAFGARKALEEEATKARLETIEELRGRKKQAGSGVRPRGSAPMEAKDIPEGVSMKEAWKIAAARTADELGVSWDDAAKGFMPGHG